MIGVSVYMSLFFMHRIHFVWYLNPPDGALLGTLSERHFWSRGSFEDQRDQRSSFTNQRGIWAFGLTRGAAGSTRAAYLPTRLSLGMTRCVLGDRSSSCAPGLTSRVIWIDHRETQCLGIGGAVIKRLYTCNTTALLTVLLV